MGTMKVGEDREDRSLGKWGMSGIREAEKERVGDSQDFYQGAKWEKKG